MSLLHEGSTEFRWVLPGLAFTFFVARIRSATSKLFTELLRAGTEFWGGGK